MLTILAADMNLRRASLALALVAAGLAPSSASAQKDPFIDALIAFRAALGGTYGDEGPQLETALNGMASSLAAWDREAAAAETELRSGLPDAPPEDRLRRRIALASLMLDRDRWAGALGDLNAAVAADPGRSFVYLARGLVRDTAGDTAGAVSDFQRAWDLDRGDAVKAYLLVTRGLTAGALDDPGPPLDALRAAQQAATGDAPPGFMEIGLLRDRADWPVLAPAAYAEGFALIAKGRYSEAVASFRAAVARDPLLIDPAAKTKQRARGSASLRDGQYAAAITHLEAALAASPASAEAHRLLGTAYHLAQRPAESLERLTTAIRLAPSDERARLALARELLTWERRVEAEEALHEAIAALPVSVEARWALAQLYIQSDRGLEAIAELEALAAVPMLAGRSQLYWLLSELHRRHQNFEAMTRALSERVRLDLNNPLVHKELGRALVRRGSRQQALAELLMTALFAPDDLETLVRIGQIHLDDERYADAEAVLRRVVARAPDLAQARFALGTTLLRLGRTAEGQVELATFQRLNVSRLEAERQTIEFETLLRNAERSAGDGRFDEAIASLEQAAAIVDDDPRVYQLLASAYATLGRTNDHARALAAYERLAGKRAVEP
jgi:tetratricopeptide (TPR) repeat protein